MKQLHRRAVGELGAGGEGSSAVLLYVFAPRIAREFGQECSLHNIRCSSVGYGQYDIFCFYDLLSQ